MRYVMALTILGVAMVAGSSAAAGPLNPPAGPVAPTHKTLTEVEPRTAINAANTPGDADSVFRIAQPGSYYLTGNVIGAVGKRGIEIASGGVSIDLNGFALQGVGGSLQGISITVAEIAAVRVHNGTVSGWGGSGIDLASGSLEGSIVEDVVASGNGLYGIRSSLDGVVRNCVARGNGSFGFVMFDGGLVEGCRADENGNDGITAGTGTMVRGCVARDNVGDGISVLEGGSVHDCVAYSNDGTGIVTSAGNVISGCAAVANMLHGITVSSGCLVTGNVARGNGASGGTGAGIRAAGADNRIEGNLCTTADFGVQVSGAGNIIVRNSCSGNTTNWDIAANNFYGPIVNRAGVLTAAVSGDVAGSTLGTTDANANFTY